MAPSTPIHAFFATLYLSLLVNPSTSIHTRRQPPRILHRAGRNPATPNPTSPPFAPTQVAIRTLFLGSDECESRLTRSEVFLLGSCHTYFTPSYKSGEAGEEAATAPTTLTATGKKEPRTVTRVKVTAKKDTITHTIYGLGGCVAGLSSVNVTASSHKRLTQVSAPIGRCMTNDEPYMVKGVAWNTSFIWSVGEFTYDFNQPSPVAGQIPYLLSRNRTPSQDKPRSCPKINAKGVISNSTMHTYTIGRCQKLADSWVTALDIDLNSSNSTGKSTRQYWVKAIAVTNETYITRRFFDSKCVFPVAESDTMENYGDCRVVNRKDKSPMLVVVGFREEIPATTAAAPLPTTTMQVGLSTPLAATAGQGATTQSPPPAQTAAAINGYVATTNQIGAATAVGPAQTAPAINGYVATTNQIGAATAVGPAQTAPAINGYVATTNQIGAATAVGNPVTMETMHATPPASTL